MQLNGVSIAKVPVTHQVMKLSDDTTLIQRQPTRNWHRIALGALVLLATFLNSFQLQQNGYGNLYYAAGVKSMLHSWSNFYFVAYDPGGFVTIDKPPVAFWLQALCAKILGFSSWSLFLPQALAGIASVLILYCLVRNKFGPVAGLVSGLVLAVTPIVVTMNRDNNVDMVLACVSLLAAWSISTAVDTGKLRWLLLGGALVGLGFNVKMLEAYLVVPAFGLFYLLASSRRWLIRLLHLGLALLVLIVVSFSWALSVDLTPSSQRPYVGSSQTNSEIELAFGYNGLGRVTIFKDLFPVQDEAPKRDKQSKRNTTTPGIQLSAALATPAIHLATSPSDKNTKKDVSTPVVSSETGNPGPLRLFNQYISGQVSWLLPLAFIGMLVLVWQQRPRWPLNYNWQAILLWGTWLLTMFIYFSENAGFHIYYMVMVAPATAALTGIGLITLWRNYQQRPTNWRGWILPVALFMSAAIQIYFLSFYSDWHWLLLLVACLSLLTALLLCALQLQHSRHRVQSATYETHALASVPTIPITQAPPLWQAHNGLRVALCLLGFSALLLTPMIWSAYTLSYPSNGGFPLAGPSSINQKKLPSTKGYSFSANQHALANYLQANRGNVRFLLATMNSSTADPLILLTDEPIMAIGGYGGWNPILTATHFQEDVHNGIVRFFYFPSAPQVSENVDNGSRTISLSQFGNIGSNSKLVRWVATSCRVVPANQWQPLHLHTTNSGTGSSQEGTKKNVVLLTSPNKPALFDCGNL